MFNGDNSSSCVEGRGRQGSQREPCAKQATIEMEMRLRGRTGKVWLDWKWQLWRGSQGEWVPGQCAFANSRTARERVAIETEQGGECRVFFLLYYFSVHGYRARGDFFINRWRYNHMLEMQISVPSKSVCN